MELDRETKLRITEEIKTDLQGWLQKLLEQQQRDREMTVMERLTRVETNIENLNQRLIDGLAAMDKRFVDLQAQMDKRFEQVDKRFEQMDKRFVDLQTQMDKRFAEMLAATDRRFADMQTYMDKRFGDMQTQIDKRFEQVDKRFASLQWMIGIGFTVITTLMSLLHFLG